MLTPLIVITIVILYFCVNFVKLSTCNKAIIKSWLDVCDYVAKQGIGGQVALQKGMQEKAIEFMKKGSEFYQKN